MAAQREWFEKDYYKVLGVVPTASEKEITRAYRKLAKENHPDTNPGSEEHFKEISAAYDVVGDADKRKEYDEVRARGPVGGFGAPGGAGGGTFRMEDMGDLGISSEVSSVAAPDGRVRPSAGRSAAPTWRHSSTCRSRTRCMASRRRSTCPGGALLELPRQRRRAGTSTHTCPRCGGRGASTTTRASSP